MQKILNPILIQKLPSFIYKIRRIRDGFYARNDGFVLLFQRIFMKTDGKIK